jgi:hypothetical protein
MKGTQIMKIVFKKVLPVVFCLALLLWLPSLGRASEVSANFSGGSGTESDPYIISTAQDLAGVAESVSSQRENSGRPYALANYLQTGDIDLSSIDRWFPIGADEKRAFFGVYDGGGHKISNPCYPGGADGQNFESYGLFGVVSGDALLRRIKIENAFSDINDARVSTFGVIVGYVASGTVRGCSSAGNGISVEIISHSDRRRKVLREVGGIIGKIRSGDVVDCVNRVNFTISSDVSALYVGGIIGRFENGTLGNCGNEGAIDLFSPGANVGGIAGFVVGGKSINCFNSGSVRIEVSRGATAGGIHAGSSGIILRCVNTGDVEVSSTGIGARAGGIVGFMHGGSIEESINIGNVLAEVKCDWAEYKKAYLSFDHIDSVPKEKIEAMHPEIKAGGLVADMWDGQLLNAANKGRVSGKIFAEGVSMDIYIGGLAGAIDLPRYIPSCVVIQDSFNTGTIRSEVRNVEASYSVGGIVGFSNVKVKRRNRILSWIFGDSKEYSKNKISGCYWLGGAGAIRGVGRYEHPGENPDDDTIELTADGFKNQDSFVGWDFKDVWAMAGTDAKAPTLKALQRKNAF